MIEKKTLQILKMLTISLQMRPLIWFWKSGGHGLTPFFLPTLLECTITEQWCPVQCYQAFCKGLVTVVVVTFDTISQWWALSAAYNKVRNGQAKNKTSLLNQSGTNTECPVAHCTESHYHLCCHQKNDWHVAICPNQPKMDTWQS